MALTLEAEYLHGIKVFKPDVFSDARGYFMEAYSRRDYVAAGIAEEFVQDNFSHSSKGVLRGMHFQWDQPMGKLLRVSSGSILLAELDVRKNSPECGKSVCLEVSSANNRVVWIPPGFANGFLVLSDFADVHYKCTAYYNAQGEGSIRWNSCGIPWGVTDPILSPKDAQAQSLDGWFERSESDFFRVQ